VAFAIVHHKRNKPRRNLPLGYDDDLFAFALNARFGPTNQLVGAFGSYQDEPKLAIDALWKFHWVSFVHPCNHVKRIPTQSDVETDWACRTLMDHEANDAQGAENNE